MIIESGKTSKREIGRKGEDYACLYLSEQGFSILERNVHCRFSEIDLIAIKEDVLFFIEVKYRKNLVYGHPLESITEIKRKRIRQSVLWYTGQNKIEKFGVSIKKCKIVYLSILGNLKNPTEIQMVEELF